MTKPLTETNGSTAAHLIGKYVIIRARDAGIHAGILAAHQGREVRLTDTRRLWYWKCKQGHSLSGVALHGLATGSKIAAPVEDITILDACEIIATTAAAENSIREVVAHDPT